MRRNTSFDIASKVEVKLNITPSFSSINDEKKNDVVKPYRSKFSCTIFIDKNSHSTDEMTFEVYVNQISCRTVYESKCDIYFEYLIGYP